MKVSNLFKAYTVLLAAIIVAAMLVVVGAADPAGAALPGKNGRIAFVREGPPNLRTEIFTVEPDGTRYDKISVRLGRDNTFPAWSSDGKKIAFSGSSRSFGSSYDIFTMKADGSGLRRITDTPRIDETHPAWSPNGERIAFDRGPHFVESVERSDIYTIKADGTGLRRLTRTKGALETEAAWSPDGKKIAFTRFGRTDTDVYTMNAVDGGQQRNLTRPLKAEARDPNWSPNGKKIAFGYAINTAERSIPSEIYTMKANGTRYTNLTKNPADDSFPAWSPDGEKITFASTRSGNSDIFVMKTDGKKVNRLTKTQAFEYAPDWQPRYSTQATAGAATGISAKDLIRDVRRDLGLDNLSERMRASVDRTLFVTTEG